MPGLVPGIHDLRRVDDSSLLPDKPSNIQSLRVDPTFRQIVQFVNGRGGPSLAVAAFPPAFSKLLGVTTTELRIGIDCAIKMRAKHRLLPLHYSVIPDCISRGRIGYHNDDLLFVHFEDQVFGSGFKLVVKSIIRPDELWVRTFHKVSLEEARRIFRKPGLIELER